MRRSFCCSLYHSRTLENLFAIHDRRTVSNCHSSLSRAKRHSGRCRGESWSVVFTLVPALTSPLQGSAVPRFLPMQSKDSKSTLFNLGGWSRSPVSLSGFYICFGRGIFDHYLNLQDGPKSSFNYQGSSPLAREFGVVASDTIRVDAGKWPKQFLKTPFCLA